MAPRTEVSPMHTRITAMALPVLVERKPHDDPGD
jgi:hypothetical protein